MRHSLLLFALLYPCSPTLAAEPTELARASEHNLFFLEEFTIDAPAGPSTQRFHCTPDEIKAGALEFVSLGKPNDGARSLSPSYDPLAQKASWLIKQEACASLRPYHNGIGLEALDLETGRATVYLAGFNQQPVDKDEWEEESGWGRMRLFFHPKYNVINVLRFSARCEFTNGWKQTFGLAPSQLLCTLDDKQGEVRFRVQR